MEDSCNAIGILSHFPTAEWNQQVLLSGSHTFVSLIPPPLPFRSVQECLSSACESDNYPLEPTRGDQVEGKAPRKMQNKKWSRPLRHLTWPQKICALHRQTTVSGIAIANCNCTRCSFHNCRFVSRLCRSTGACNCGFVTYRKLIHCTPCFEHGLNTDPFPVLQTYIYSSIHTTQCPPCLPDIIAFKWFCVVVCALSYCP